jgi:hypothetical protein
MSEIVLQIHDEPSLDQITALLAPFVKKAEVKAGGKIWSGKAEWLTQPVRIDDFTPLTWEEAHKEL